MGLSVEVEPREVGLDGTRLRRIDSVLRRYVDDGKLPGWLVMVARRGRVAHLSTYGMRDVEAGLPVEPDTLFRIYSMTKPVTTAVAMGLVEEGALGLNDPVSRFVPAFADMQVYASGSSLRPQTEPAREPIRLWHLMTHTAGLTYGFHRDHPVDAMYRAAGHDVTPPNGADLATCCETWGSLPLLSHPGTRWNYSVATDVLARVIEVVNGQGLDTVFADRLFGPLGMVDTGFHVPRADHGRLAALYATPKMVRHDGLGEQVRAPRAFLSGGGGLVSTVADYHRFTQMLARGGELDGVRLLGPRTIRYMTRNHLPGGADLATVGRPLSPEFAMTGVGFGLGFAVVLDPAQSHVLTGPGEYGWGGAASTAFWIDPAEELAVIFLTQLFPSSTYPLRTQLRALVYQAVVD